MPVVTTVKMMLTTTVIVTSTMVVVPVGTTAVPVDKTRSWVEEESRTVSNCVSCSQQAYCESTCSTSIGGYFTSTIPGLCWAWSACFRGCCAEASKGRYKKDTEDNFEFCGDFVCQEGEDHTSCPADCCPDYNPVNCTRPSNQCNPDCCLHPSCCKDESAANTHSASSPLIAFSMLSICIFLSGL